MGPRLFNGERIVFSTDSAGTIGYPHKKEQKFDFYPISHTNSNTQQTKDLNIRPKHKNYTSL